MRDGWVGAVKAHIIFLTWPASINVPTSTLPVVPPWPLEIPVKLFRPLPVQGGDEVSGESRPPKPGNIMVEPSGMSATASSKLWRILFFMFRRSSSK